MRSTRGGIGGWGLGVFLWNAGCASQNTLGPALSVILTSSSYTGSPAHAYIFKTGFTGSYTYSHKHRNPTFRSWPDAWHYLFISWMKGNRLSTIPDPSIPIKNQLHLPCYTRRVRDERVIKLTIKAQPSTVSKSRRIPAPHIP